MLSTLFTLHFCEYVVSFNHHQRTVFHRLSVQGLQMWESLYESLVATNNRLCMIISLPKIGPQSQTQGDSAWMPNLAAVQC
jgi:hypothetical protein